MKLKLLRISKGLTQVELAKMAGVIPRIIIAIEREKHDEIKLGVLKRIAYVLNTTIDELFL